jgi:hypothetical protein
VARPEDNYMDFTRKKLPREAAEKMRICPVDTVKPFVFMPAPVYVYMKLNEKFVSVKAPLDFFTPEELVRLRPFEAFFLPDFIDSVAPFRSYGRAIRGLLAWQPASVVALSPTPFEISDTVIRMIGPLWGKDVAIEPFFVAVFVAELCDPMPSETLLDARDRDVEVFENAIVISSWAVFIALHLGHCNLGYLNRLRLAVFEEVVRGKSPGFARQCGMEDILAVAGDSFRHKSGIVRGESHFQGSDHVSQKMASRLARVKREFAETNADQPTIYGQKGFIDG